MGAHRGVAASAVPPLLTGPLFLFLLGGFAPAAAPRAAAPSAGEVTVEVPGPLRMGAFARPRHLRVPPGFRVSLVAVVPGVRFGVFGPDGRLAVSQTRAGRVVALDASGRGSVLASGLDRPHGLAYRGSVLYVAETGRVVRLPRPGVVEVVTTDLPAGGMHFTRTLGFGPDGGLYVSVGSDSPPLR